MSFVLHLWQRPIPETAEAAAEFVFEAPRVKPSDSAVFVELAKRLTARYPCITTLEADEGVWTDGPPDGQCEEHIYVIGIVSEHVAEVVPFVVATANELGLTVYDMQDGIAYPPSGSVLQPKEVLPQFKKPWWKGCIPRAGTGMHPGGSSGSAHLMLQVQETVMQKQEGTSRAHRPRSQPRRLHHAAGRRRRQSRLHLRRHRRVGHHAVEGRVPMHDLHATILHLLGSRS